MKARHLAILRLVRDGRVSTQEQLAEALRGEGFDVVQTTVSRDVHELGLVKVRRDGRLVYAAAEEPREAAPLAAALRSFALGLEAAASLVVVSTPAGYASALAEALDRSGHPGIAGTIAGENTIFVAPREGTSAAELRDDLRNHLLKGAA